MAPSRFSATIVTFHPDAELFARALVSLAAAIGRARESGAISESRVFIVDNGGASSAGAVRGAATLLERSGIAAEFVSGHGNVGYGRANNLVLPKLDSDVHLVMNPDVELDPDALVAAIGALQGDPSIGLVAPDACG